MRMSTKGRYGLRAVLQIASEDGEPVSVRAIAQREGLSDRYLEQLMRRLRTAGIVTSARGARGGYLLARSASEVTVADVLDAVGESVEPVECIELQGKGQCPTGSVCRTKRAWKKLNDGILGITKSMTIGSLLSSEDDQDIEKDTIDERNNLHG